MISLVLSLSWKFGDDASTVATQLFFHGTAHVVLICPHYRIQIQQICNSGNSDSAYQLSVVQHFVAQYHVTLQNLILPDK